jgi:hypothetical protein
VSAAAPGALGGASPTEPVNNVANLRGAAEFVTKRPIVMENVTSSRDESKFVTNYTLIASRAPGAVGPGPGPRRVRSACQSAAHAPGRREGARS